MSWIDMLDDPRNVKAIYGDVVPSLSRVVLHEIRIHRDGPKVTFVFDFEEFPVNPPVKWQAQGLDTVQTELTVDGLTGMSLDGIDTNSVVDIDLAKSDEEVRLTTSSNSSSRVDVRGRWVSVSSISAYLNGAQPKTT